MKADAEPLHLAVGLRRRTAWQAADLGFAVARRWWLKLWLAWLLPALVVFVPLSLLLPDDLLWVAGMGVWWLKPLWDAMPLYIASRRLHGSDASLRETWRKVPLLLARELPAWLLWRRLSPTRSADMPLSLLERVRGAARHQRMRVLHTGMGGTAGWLTIACVHFEWILILGAVGLAVIMLPDQVEVDAMALFTNPAPLYRHIAGVLTLLAASLVAPAYTMGGFMLYICRRIELEGWDIEIRFRDLAARSGGRSVLTGLAAMLLASMLLLAPDDGVAAAPRAPTADLQPGATSPATADQGLPADGAGAGTRIRAVLDGDDFHDKVDTYRLRARNPDDKEEQDPEKPEWLRRFEAWLKSLGRNGDMDERARSIAAIVELLLWLGAAGLVLWGGYRLLRLRGLLHLPSRGEGRSMPAPTVLFGHDLRPECLPADVLAAVQAEWRSGRIRAAVGLLYRATLARLVAREAMPFSDHHTEGECVAIVRSLRPELGDFFADLTLAWQRLAYAHHAPPEARFDALCLRWRELFDHAQ